MITYKVRSMAINKAIDYSKEYQILTYVTLSTSTGKYYVDTEYLNYSDEKLIATYLNGKAQ